MFSLTRRLQRVTATPTTSDPNLTIMDWFPVELPNRRCRCRCRCRCLSRCCGGGLPSCGCRQFHCRSIPSEPSNRRWRRRCLCSRRCACGGRPSYGCRRFQWWSNPFELSNRRWRRRSQCRCLHRYCCWTMMRPRQALPITERSTVPIQRRSTPSIRDHGSGEPTCSTCISSLFQNNDAASNANAHLVCETSDEVGHESARGAYVPALPGTTSATASRARIDGRTPLKSRTALPTSPALFEIVGTLSLRRCRYEGVNRCASNRCRRNRRFDCRT